jgi:hypothetical protein
VTVVHSSQDEFYDGEFSGSMIVVTTQSLAQAYPLNFTPLLYNSSGSNSTSPAVGSFTWQTDIKKPPLGTQDSPLYVSSLYINETDLNGTLINTALANLSPGDTITFTISGSVEAYPVMPPAPTPYNLTFNGLITSINPISPTVWYIQLSSNVNSAAVISVVDFNTYINSSSNLSNTNIFLSPFINDVSDYYNSDYNPLINNVVDIRQNSLYQDIDYSQGSLVPVNFQQLINGDATPATVQDSNYTSARHIIPRYEGSKSTSQKLNVWTDGDVGTYGKLPTIDSNKVWVAYCDTIGGYAPERMNASGIIIKYLIDQDGNIDIPNTSENSLYATQGAFQTGERLSIFANSLNSGQTNYRTIIRGGQRIDPILYTQIGHSPANWTSSLNLINNNAQDNITDITALSSINPRFGYSPVAQYITTTEENLGDPSNTGVSSNDGWSILYDPNNRRTGNHYYTVPSSAITQGVNLIIDANIQIFNAAPSNRIVQVKLNRLRGATVTSLQTQNISFNAYEEKGVPFNIILFPQIDILTNDELYFTIQNLTPIPSGTGTVQVTYQNTYFNTSQNPLPNPFASVTVATGSIWNYPTSSTYNQASSSNAGIIYIPLTGSALNVYYNVEGIQQQDISSSGFNPINTDWSVKIGDEFRFEGREDRVFMVKKVFSPTFSSLERISNTGSLEIHLDNSIPSASINLDHFLIRRYVDDPSAIIFEGFKPTTGTSPYLVKPEYVTPSLNKNLDSFITDLTQKGLL